MTLLGEINCSDAELKAIHHALIKRVVLSIRPVKQDRLADHLVAHDRDMAQCYLLVNLYLLVVVMVTNFRLQYADNPPYHY